MTKAMEILNELNTHDVEDLYKNTGEIKAVLTILDVIEHEILEESRNDYDIISNKYYKLLEILRKSALNLTEPMCDLVVKDANGELFCVDDIMYNNYIINDMYGILSMLDNSNIVDIVEEYDGKDLKEIKIHELRKGEVI